MIAGRFAPRRTHAAPRFPQRFDAPGRLASITWKLPILPFSALTCLRLTLPTLAP